MVSRAVTLCPPLAYINDPLQASARAIIDLGHGLSRAGTSGACKASGLAGQQAPEQQSPRGLQGRMRREHSRQKLTRLFDEGPCTQTDTRQAVAAATAAVMIGPPPLACVQGPSGRMRDLEQGGVGSTTA